MGERSHQPQPLQAAAGQDDRHLSDMSGKGLQWCVREGQEEEMLDRKVRKMIEWWFYNYESKRKEAAEYLVELAEQGITARYEGLGIRNSSVSNPTESKGIKTLDGRKSALWCKVVENTLTTFRWEIEYRVIELFYFKHKSGRGYVICSGYPNGRLHTGQNV